MNNILN